MSKVRSGLEAQGDAVCAALLPSYSASNSRTIGMTFVP